MINNHPMSMCLLS